MHTLKAQHHKQTAGERETLSGFLYVSLTPHYVGAEAFVPPPKILAAAECTSGAETISCCARDQLPGSTFQRPTLAFCRCADKKPVSHLNFPAPRIFLGLIPSPPIHSGRRMHFRGRDHLLPRTRPASGDRFPSARLWLSAVARKGTRALPRSLYRRAYYFWYKTHFPPLLAPAGS